MSSIPVGGSSTKASRSANGSRIPTHPASVVPAACQPDGAPGLLDKLIATARNDGWNVVDGAKGMRLISVAAAAPKRDSPLSRIAARRCLSKSQPIRAV